MDVNKPTPWLSNSYLYDKEMVSYYIIINTGNIL